MVIDDKVLGKDIDDRRLVDFLRQTITEQFGDVLRPDYGQLNVESGTSDPNVKAYSPGFIVRNVHSKASCYDDAATCFVQVGLFIDTTKYIRAHESRPQGDRINIEDVIAKAIRDFLVENPLRNMEPNITIGSGPTVDFGYSKFDGGIIPPQRTNYDQLGEWQIVHPWPNFLVSIEYKKRPAGPLIWRGLNPTTL